MRIPWYWIGLIEGIVVALIAVYSYSEGRASIVEQCIEHRAFTYGDGAWGCVRLRKSSREMERDEVITNQGVKT